jgi:uncharacterized protein (DUF2249 family)
MSTSTQHPVSPSDRVSDVLARDERLVEVFARQTPHFAKLRNPMMRRVMARLVTVEQAARICGAPAESLVHELNRALGIEERDDANGAADRIGHGIGEHATGAPAEARAPIDDPDESGSFPAAGAPDAPFSLPPETHVVELDVREDLRLGREPFSRIMRAVGELREDQALRLRATFEPVPLFAVMEKRGFEHHAEQEGSTDWSVWFYRRPEGAASTGADAPRVASPSVAPSGAPDAGVAADAAIGSAADTTGEIVLDVRGLEPPEPMQRTLEAAEQLGEDAVLVHVNVRVPHFLLPILRERGFDYEIYQASPERVVVRIWRESPAASTRATPGG